MILRLVDVHLRHRNGAASLLCGGASLANAGLQLLIVQAGEYLAATDLITFFDEQFRDETGDLRAHIDLLQRGDLSIAEYNEGDGSQARRHGLQRRSVPYIESG